MAEEKKKPEGIDSKVKSAMQALKSKDWGTLKGQGVLGVGEALDIQHSLKELNDDETMTDSQRYHQMNRLAQQYEHRVGQLIASIEKPEWENSDNAELFNAYGSMQFQKYWKKALWKKEE